jgi:hypothetical protein
MRSAFGTVFRQPTIYLAAFVWRSVFAIALTLLAFYAAIGYLDSMEVTDRDLLGLAGIIPGTVGAALTHIFKGTGPMLVRVAVAVIFGAGSLWLVLATVGQSVTLSALFGAERPAVRAVASWNLARLALWYLAITALVGATLVAFNRSQLADGGQDRGKFYALAMPLWLLVLWVTSFVSSYMSVAALRQVSAAHSWRSGGSQFLWVAFATAVMRLALWFAALFAFFVVLSMALQAPAEIGWALLLIFAIVYSASSTLIHLLKLAGYVRVVKWEAEEPGALAAMV